MDDNEIPCKLIPNMHWRKSPQSGYIWYMSKRTPRGINVPVRTKDTGYHIVFDPVAFPGAGTSLEEQMHLEEIKWMMGEL